MFALRRLDPKPQFSDSVVLGHSGRPVRNEARETEDLKITPYTFYDVV